MNREGVEELAFRHGPEEVVIARREGPSVLAPAIN